MFLIFSSYFLLIIKSTQEWEPDFPTDIDTLAIPNSEAQAYLAYKSILCSTDEEGQNPPLELHMVRFCPGAEVPLSFLWLHKSSTTPLLRSECI